MDATMNCLPTGVHLRSMISRYALLAACATLLLFFPRTTHAQRFDDTPARENYFTLTAIPPRTETIVVNPGDTAQIKIQVRNVSPERLFVTSEVQDFIIDKDGSTPIPLSTEDALPLRWSLASWMTIVPSGRVIEKNELASYAVVIQVPKDALPGGHYAMITHFPSIVEDGRPGQTKPSSTAITAKVGTLVYVQVNGDIHEEAFIRNFSAPEWVEFGPVDFSYDIESASDIHLSPQASLTIKNMFGFTKETIVVPSKNIFPYSSRAFDTAFNQVWGFGPYFAKLTVSYGTTGKIVTASKMFWIIPYRILMAVTVVLLALLAIVIVFRRHLEHRNDVRSQHIEVLEERIRDLEKKTRQR